MAKNIDFDSLMTSTSVQSGPAKGGIDFDRLFGATETKAAPERNLFARTNDFMVDAGNAAAGLVKSGVDLVAPGSAASNAIGDFMKGGEAKQSDWKQGQRKALSEDLAAADGEIEKVKAYGRHVANDPMEVAAQAVGNVGPFRALGLAFQAAGWGTKATMLAAGSLSAGEVRGNILDKVLSKDDLALAAENPEYAGLRAKGMSEADAKKEIGTRFLDHLPELMATAVAGSLGGKYGFEGIAAGVGKAAKNRAAAAGISALDEGLQGAVEQVATNVGVRRIDPTQKLGDDVLLNAVQEGLPGGVGGGVAHVSHAREQAVEPPSAPAVRAQVQQAEQAAPQAAPAAGPSQSQALAASAFADVGGDETVASARQADKAHIAMSLNQIGEHDGQEAMVKAIEHLSGGDSAMAETLFEASQDKALIKSSKAALDTNALGFIEINEGIRQDAGLIEGQAAPVANTQQNQPAPAVNSAGFMPEPVQQVQAQVAAVREGRKPGALFGLEEAKSLDVTGLAQGIATGPDGKQALVIAQDDETVQKAVARAAEVGVAQAGGELRGVVDPEAVEAPLDGKAIVQHVDKATGQVIHEEAVLPEQVNSVRETPGTTTVVRPAAAVAQERQAAMPAPVEQAAPAAPQPTFFARRSESRAEPYTDGEQTGAAARMVDGLNASLGLSGPTAVDRRSIIEVTPSKNLSRMQRAIGTAFGVNLVFVKGNLTRANGEHFNSFSGVADRAHKTILLNVEANAPLAVLGHELAHIMETEQPALYDRLETVVLSRMRLGAAKALQQRLQAAMDKEGNTAAAAEFRKEVVAEGIGQMAEDQKLWADVFGSIGEEQTLAKIFYKQVMDVIAKLQRALTSAGFITGVRDVATVKKAVVAAYQAWAKEYEVKGGNLANLTAEGQEMLHQFRSLAATDAFVEKAAEKKAAKAVETKAKEADDTAAEVKASPTATKITGTEMKAPKAVNWEEGSDEGVSFAREEPAAPGEGFGRAGAVDTNPRWQSGERKGQYIGAPTKYNTPAKIPTLRRLFAQLAAEGEPGKLWYERSGKAMMQMVGGNRDEAHKFVSLLAIYSPQARIDANSTFAIRAWTQYKAGKPISVKTGAMDAKATAVLYDNKPWGGEKTNNFYKNLMREVDSQTHGAEAQGVTVDMWMMRAAGFETDAPTDTAYRFVENETNRLAAELGWEPQQVQAAIWVAMKARTENKAVKAATMKESIKKGYSEYVEGSKGALVLKLNDETKHRNTWMKHALAMQLSDADIEGAKFDYADGVRRHMGQVSWEARPGRSTGVLPGVNDAPYHQQAEFQQAVADALTGPNGQDMLAEKLGLLADGNVLAPGVWQGEVAAGMQSFVSMIPDKDAVGKVRMDPTLRDAVNAYADVMGLLLRQEGVGWHKPFYDTTKGKQNGLELDIGRPFTSVEAGAMWDAMNREMPAAGVADWENSTALISTSNGMRVVSFGALPNDQFRAAALKAAQSLSGDLTIEHRGFASDGELRSNNWKEQQNGETYRQGLSAAGRSDVLRWADDVLAPAVQAVFNDFSERYGWGNPGKPGSAISFSRAGGQPDAVVQGERDRAPAYGRRTPGAVSVTGWHFSQQQRPVLSSALYGTGLKGSGREGYLSAADKRLAQRIYFYADKGQGINPESGVGGYSHEVRLDNIYDSDTDHLGLKSGTNWEKFEAAVLDKGFDGFLYRAHNQSAAVVLLGPRMVPVKPNQEFRASTPTVPAAAVKAPAARTEGNERVYKPQGDEVLQLIRAKAAVQEAAPSFRMEFGSARVATNEAQAANEALQSNGWTGPSFQRNPLKMESVQDALDFTSTKDLKLKLGDALDRDAWADAYMLAKDANERKGLMAELGDKAIEMFADSKIRMSRWVAALPLPDTMRQRLEGDLRRSDTVRSTLEQDVKDRFTEPMMKAITRAAKATKMSSDQVKKMAGYWMAATYAPEASAQLITKDRTALLAAQATGDANMIAAAQQNLNDRILDVNGAIGQAKVRGVAGGMNNAEAAQMVQNVEQHIDVALLQDIAKPVYDMLAWKKAKDIASGKVSQAMVNSWLNSPRYVPLTGDPRFDRESTDVFSAGGQLNQDADKAMNGRKDSVADDGIDAAFTGTIKSINFAAMQDFKRTLNAAYVAAAGQDIGVTREPITGIMRTGDDVITYRDSTTGANGQQVVETHAFKFRDQRIIEAIKKDNIEHLNSVLKTFSTASRWYARAVTQFMPMFAPINLVRDIWERSELLRTKKLYDAAGGLIDVQKVARAAIADTINRDVWKASMMKAFKRGGMTAVRGDLEEMVRLGGSSTTGDYLDRSSGDLEASIRGDASKLGHARNVVMHKVEAWNDTFEMIPSLSIYRALKGAGMAPKDAAAATLDLMNFRKKGTVMPAVRALYVFAQPAATGGYNLAQYLNTRTGKIRFAAQVAIGTALYALLKGAWGDDDDEELGNKLDNLSNFTVERSIPIKLGDYVLKLPVGFGPPQLAWMTAGIMNRFASGRYNAADAAGEIAKGWVKNFAAISPSEMEMSKRPVDFWVQTFTPTVLKPLFNIYADQTAFGAPLTPAFKNPDKLKSEQARRTTPGAYSEIAKVLHDELGIDVYPDHIKAMTDGYLVGPLREIMNMTIEADSKAQRGEPERVPLVASLIDSINDRQMLNSIYSRVRNDMDRGHREISSLIASNDPDGMITAEMRQQEKAYKTFLAAEKVIGMQRSALHKMPGLDEDSLAERTQAIETRADEARRKLLVQYYQNQ